MGELRNVRIIWAVGSMGDMGDTKSTGGLTPRRSPGGSTFAARVSSVGSIATDILFLRFFLPKTSTGKDIPIT
jgi:hypothetical protein